MQMISLAASHLVIPINKIDGIKWEEMAGGKLLVKLWSGGYIHHLEFDDKEQAINFYDETIQSIREL